MTCNKQHRYNPLFDTLPHSQGGDGRHKCAGCAYELGYHDGFNNQTPKTAHELDLPDSQAGTVRHKDTQSAYNLGYQKGLDDR